MTLISERTQAGLAAARARGRKGGRPTVMTPSKLAVAHEKYGSGEHTMAAIAAVVGVSRVSLYRHLAGKDASRFGTVTPQRALLLDRSS